MATTMLALLATVAAQAAPPTYHMNLRNLKIPIVVNAAARTGEVRELVMYVSIDQGRVWTQSGVARVSDPHFEYTAPSDGQYWFNIVVVFADGRREPLDINAAPPQMKVVIDTQKPAVQIGSLGRAGDDVVVAWDVRDNGAVNPSAVKVEYRSADPSAGEYWMTAPAPAVSAGQARFRPAIAGPLVVRVSAADQAGNTAFAEQELAPAVAPPPITQAGAVSPPISPAPVAPAPAAPTPVAPVPVTPAPVEPYPVQSPVAPPPDFATPPDHYTNETQITFEYELDRVGPSGIGKVEVYLTQDDGRTWMKWHDLARDAVRSGDGGTLSVNVRLPDREGVYGFRIVPHSGSQLSMGAPQSGEEPEVRVLLDRTVPAVKLFAPEADATRPNALVLGWSAADANLGPTPVRLQWSDRADGDWRNIAGSAERTGGRELTGPGVPNSGRFTWVPPADVPLRVYLRITVVDLAGNVGEAVTGQPIVVDLHKPRGRIKGLVDPKRPPTRTPPNTVAPVPQPVASPVPRPVAVPPPSDPEPTTTFPQEPPRPVVPFAD